MSESEKITINISPVDLGRIDLLVAQGLYSNRSDLIRTGIRNQLDRHEAVIQDATVRRSFALGVLAYSRQDLEERQARGEKLSMRVIGLLSLAEDISPELAQETIQSITVHGSLRTSKAVREALADRINNARSSG
jgi:Arc/MetJ-type ribon-helix-helix transcriptional regulator